MTPDPNYLPKENAFELVEGTITELTSPSQLSDPARTPECEMSDV